MIIVSATLSAKRGFLTCKGFLSLLNYKPQSYSEILSQSVSFSNHSVALETRFSQKALGLLQTNLITLGKFTADLSSIFLKQMIDRFRKLIFDVRTIDASQVPSDKNLLAVLEESIVTVEGLWSQLEFNTPNSTLEIAMDIISRWRTAKQSSGVKTRSETVANLVLYPHSWTGRKKKAYSKHASHCEKKTPGHHEGHAAEASADVVVANVPRNFNNDTKSYYLMNLFLTDLSDALIDSSELVDSKQLHLQRELEK